MPLPLTYHPPDSHTGQSPDSSFLETHAVEDDGLVHTQNTVDTGGQDYISCRGLGDGTVDNRSPRDSTGEEPDGGVVHVDCAAPGLGVGEA